MNIVHPAIERYAEKYSAKESALLKALVAETRRAMGGRARMQVGRLEGAFLKLLMRLIRAKRVLEIGTFTGYSALAMAEALPKNGTLITCDVDPVATAIARDFWKRSPHGKKITLRLGPAAETIKHLKGLFDAVFIDADKPNYPLYWELCVPRVRSGGLLIVDNVLWSGEVLRPKDRDSRAIHALNQKAARDPRVEPVLATIRDGVLLAFRR